ncbi:MAG: hypothetical protein OEY24_08745 [Candidatus Bathyarchaeota archaeon]|nr:hypothetical protein [Candidatus Bathyarchaeota archaeon]MDH5495770.1 hypothetical protein [Candidatus Bathyarchaeota archaeon]
MEKSLDKSKLFGIRKATSQTVISTTSNDISITQRNNCTIEKALLEAERKKAEATIIHTILRRYTLVR